MGEDERCAFVRRNANDSRVLGVKCEGESDEYSCVCAVKIECAEREVDGAI